MKSGRFVLLGLLAGCAPGDDRDAWTGVYAGSWLSEARRCSDGAVLEPLTDAFDVEIIESDERLAIDGRCLIEFDLVSRAHGRLVPSTCDYNAADGTPIHVEYTAGEFDLDGPELAYRLSLRWQSPAACEYSTDTFVGTRR